MNCKYEIFFLKIIIIIAALSAGFSGCKEEKTTDKKVVEISFWHAMGGPLGRVLDPMIEDFNQTHPGIRVKGVNMGNYTALSQKIMASVAADNPPEIAQAYEAWTTQLIKSKIIVPLSDFIEGPQGFSKQSFEDILPVFIKNNTWEGKIWSFPFNKSTMALYYNIDLFKKAGLDSEKPPATWEDFIHHAEKLTMDTNGDGKADVTGTACQISAWMFENFLLQNGGSLLSEDGKRIAYDSPLGVEALRFYDSFAGKSSKIGYITGGFDFQNDFLAGRVGMVQSSTVSLAFIQDKIQFQMGIAPIPGHKKNAVIVAGTNVVIFERKEDEKKKAAWEFIKWFTDTENTARWAAATGYTPVRWSALNTPIMLAQLEKWQGLRAVYEQLQYAEFEPTFSAWLEGRNYLGEDAIEAVLRGKASPEQALKAAAKKTNNLIKIVEK